MVSTRGVRYKFSEGERVLCYEPDPTKAKVLYDSKVLEVIENKDKRGRRTIEYLIHFQGWNSSWDRCVGEDFVLKDTEENRQLQRDLAEKSQLQLGAYLYRRERKKGSTSGSAGSSAKRSRHRFSDDGSSSSTQPDDTEEQGEGDAEDAESQESLDEDNKEMESSTESSDSGARQASPGDHIVPVGRAHLTMPAVLRDRLTFDYHLIVKRNRLTRLPASPCAAQILESFVKWFARAGAWNTPRCRNEPPQKPDLADVSRRLNLVREVADGLRVYFDFIMRGNLLYKPELVQYHEVCGQFLDQQERKMKEELEEEDSQDEYEEETASAEESLKSPKIPEYSHLPPDPSDANDPQYSEELIPADSIKREIKEEPEDIEEMQEDMHEDMQEDDMEDDMQDMEDQEMQDDEEFQHDIKEEIQENQEYSQEDIQDELEEQEESQEDIQDEIQEEQEDNEEESNEQEHDIEDEEEEQEMLDLETDKCEAQVEKEEVENEKSEETKKKKSLSLSLKKELKEDEKPLKVKQEKEESQDSQKPQSPKAEDCKQGQESAKEVTKVEDKVSSEDSEKQENPQTQNDPQKDETTKQEPTQDDSKNQDDIMKQCDIKKEDAQKMEEGAQIEDAPKKVAEESVKQTVEDVPCASGSEPRSDDIPARRQLLRPNTRSSRRSNNSPALNTALRINSPAHGSSSPMPNSPSVRQNSPALRNNSPAAVEDFPDRSADDPNNFANTVRNQITRRATRHRSRWNNSPANPVVEEAPQTSQSANVPIIPNTEEPHLLLEIKQEPVEPETSRRETRSRRWTNSPAVNSAEETADSHPTEALITDIKQEPVEAKPGTRSGSRRLRSHKSAVSQSENEEPQPSTSTAEPRNFEHSSSVGSGSGSSNEEWSKPAEPTPIPSSSTRNPLSQLLDKVSKYEIIPREGTEHLPCRVYGAIHLARLFVRMPDFLNATQMSDFKLKLVVKHIDMFIQYLVEHKEWFGEKYYYCDSMSRST